MEEIDLENLPKHIAIIMDGNRRWAKARGLTTKDGHKAGSKNLDNIATFCNEIGIKYLTVYAFSTENWKRTQEEVSALMFILKANLDSMLRKLDLKNIKITCDDELLARAYFLGKVVKEEATDDLFKDKTDYLNSLEVIQWKTVRDDTESFIQDVLDKLSLPDLSFLSK